MSIFSVLCAQSVQCRVDIFHYTVLWIRLRHVIRERLDNGAQLTWTTTQVSAVSQNPIISVELHRFLVFPIN